MFWRSCRTRMDPRKSENSDFRESEDLAARLSVLYRSQTSVGWHVTKASRATGQGPCPVGWDG